MPAAEVACFAGKKLPDFLKCLRWKKSPEATHPPVEVAKATGVLAKCCIGFALNSRLAPEPAAVTDNNTIACVRRSAVVQICVLL